MKFSHGLGSCFTGLPSSARLHWVRRQVTWRPRLPVTGYIERVFGILIAITYAVSGEWAATPFDLLDKLILTRPSGAALGDLLTQAGFMGASAFRCHVDVL